MPSLTEITFRNKRKGESELDYIEYKIRRVKMMIARQEWLRKHRNVIQVLAIKNKELEDELINYLLVTLTNRTTS